MVSFYSSEDVLACQGLNLCQLHAFVFLFALYYSANKNRENQQYEAINYTEYVTRFDVRPKKEDVDDDGEDDEDLDDDDADGKDLGNGIDSCWWLRSFPACNPYPLHCLALNSTMMPSTTR